MPKLTESNVGDFYQALERGEVVVSQDLVSKYPEVKSDCPWGTYTVLVYALSFEGADYFVSMEEGCEYSADPNSCLQFCTSLEEALEVLAVIERAWCEKWGTC